MPQRMPGCLFVCLFVCKYKTLEYDLAMEGNNAALMAKVVASLWPTPKTGESDVIEQLNQIAGENWVEKTSEERAKAAHEILKRIDDSSVGKGIFAQVFSDEIKNESLHISVPQYINDAILWACSLEDVEVPE